MIKVNYELYKINISLMYKTPDNDFKIIDLNDVKCEDEKEKKVIIDTLEKAIEYIKE